MSLEELCWDKNDKFEHQYYLELQLVQLILSLYHIFCCSL